jgi:hypothetical protein
MNTCFIDGKIVFLRTVGKTYYPVVIDDLVEEFGLPDAVGYCCEDFAYRILVWAEEGIMIDIDLFEDERSTIALFPPITTKELENSWIMAELWYPDVDSYADEVPEWLLARDPWGFTDD